MKNRFVQKITQGAIFLIYQIVTEDVPIIREALGAHQKVLLKEIFTDAARSCMQILRTTKEVSVKVRHDLTPRDANTIIAAARLTLQSLNFIGASDSPLRTRTQDIVIPRRSIIPKKCMTTETLNALINKLPAVHGHPAPIFSKVIGTKTTPEERADVYAHKRMG